MKSLIQILKKCEWCGKEFAAYKCSTRYCSKQCNGYAYKDNLRKKRIEACHNEMEMQEAEKNLDGATSRNYLTPTQAAKLLGIGRATLYRYLSDNRITATQFKGKTLIRRKDIDKLFDEPKPYQKRPKKDRAPIRVLHKRREHHRMVLGRGYASEIRNDPLGGLLLCIYLRYSQEKGQARGLLLQTPCRYGKGCRRAGAAGVLHHTRSDGEIRAYARPAVPLRQVAQGAKGTRGSLRISDMIKLNGPINTGKGVSGGHPRPLRSIN